MVNDNSNRSDLTDPDEYGCPQHLRGPGREMKKTNKFEA